MKELIRWSSVGALIGVAVGLAALATGYVLSARHGNAEPMEGVALTLAVITAPVSLFFVWVGDTFPSDLAAGFATWGVFLVAPPIQGALIATGLCAIRALASRRADAA